MDLMNKNSIFLLEELVKKNFAAKYKDSLIGILWSILQPLFLMVLMTIIFSSIFKASIENFPVYFLSAKCIFDFFNTSTTSSMMALKGNKGILEKNILPKYIFILGGIFSEFLNFIITLFILAGVMIATNAPLYFNTIPFAIIPIISLIIMNIGIGLILSILCVYFTDIRHLWSVLSFMILYASAVFFPIEIVPMPYRGYMMLNPVFWIIDQFRHFIFWGTMPETLNMINSLLLSSIILIFGIIIFKKYEKRIIMKF